MLLPDGIQAGLVISLPHKSAGNPPLDKPIPCGRAIADFETPIAFMALYELAASVETVVSWDRFVAIL